MIARILVADLDFREMNRGTIYGHSRLRFFLASPVRQRHNETMCAFSRVGVVGAVCLHRESEVVRRCISVGCVRCTL